MPILLSVNLIASDCYKWQKFLDISFFIYKSIFILKWQAGPKLKTTRKYNINENSADDDNRVSKGNEDGFSETSKKTVEN